MLNFGELREKFKTRISEPEAQRRLVLVVVSTALLLDNMLYMVIVPIVPDYLNKTHALDKNARINYNDGNTNKSIEVDDITQTIELNAITYEIQWIAVASKDTKIGLLFAFKAIVQLFINPISGTVIDRMGYDFPMMLGLCIIFVSTSIFAFGTTYSVMFVARGLQGVGSAFADTAAFAMIADRFQEERATALGVALAFVSFGCLVAPPFGGVLYEYCGKEFPFIVLAFIAVFDGFLMLYIMKPVRLEKMIQKAEGNQQNATPIHRLFLDHFVAICAGALAFCNISLAFLEPTIALWMEAKMNASNWQVGLIWLPAFIPHVLGVYTTVRLAKKYPEKQWLMAAVGLTTVGSSCLFIPFCNNFISLMIPICILCYGVALVDTAIFPMLAYIVDTRHVSVYGSVYAIADISYSLAYAIGPIVAGSLISKIGFTGLNIAIFFLTIIFVPLLYPLRKVYNGTVPPLEKKEPESLDNQHSGFIPPSVPVAAYGGYDQGDIVDQSSQLLSQPINTQNTYYYGGSNTIRSQHVPQASVPSMTNTTYPQAGYGQQQASSHHQNVDNQTTNNSYYGY